MSKELTATRLQQSQNDTKNTECYKQLPAFVCIKQANFIHKFSVRCITLCIGPMRNITLLKLEFQACLCGFYPTNSQQQCEESCSDVVHRENCWMLFFSRFLPHSSFSLIKKINLYSNGFRLCVALQKGAISNLIRKDGARVWKRLWAIACSFFIMKISQWNILRSISKQLKCRKVCMLQ